jgi:hypothetical protein
MESVQGSLFENIVNFRCGSIISNVIKGSDVVKICHFAASKAHLSICLCNSKFNLYCMVVLDLVPCHDGVPSRAEISQFYDLFKKGKRGSIPHTLTFFTTSPPLSVSFMALREQLCVNTLLVMALENGAINLFYFAESRKWQHWKSIQTCQERERLSDFVFDMKTQTMLWISIGTKGTRLRSCKVDISPTGFASAPEACFCVTVVDISSSASLHDVRAGECWVVSLPTALTSSREERSNSAVARSVQSSSEGGSRDSGGGSRYGSGSDQPHISVLSLCTGQMCSHPLSDFSPLKDRAFRLLEVQVLMTGKGGPRLSSVLVCVFGHGAEGACELWISHATMRANKITMSPSRQVKLPHVSPIVSPYVAMGLRAIEGGTGVILSVGGCEGACLYHASMDDVLRCLNVANSKKSTQPGAKGEGVSGLVWTQVHLPVSAGHRNISKKKKSKREVQSPSQNGDDESSCSDRTKAMWLWETNTDLDYNSTEDALLTLPTYGACCLRTGEMWGLTSHARGSLIHTSRGAHSEESATATATATHTSDRGNKSDPKASAERMASLRPEGASEHKHSRHSLYDREKWYHDVPALGPPPHPSSTSPHAHPITRPLTDVELSKCCKQIRPSGTPVVHGLDVVDQVLRGSRSLTVLSSGGLDDISLAAISSHFGTTAGHGQELTPDMLQAAILHLLFVQHNPSDSDSDCECGIDPSLPRVSGISEGGGFTLEDIDHLQAMQSPLGLEEYFTSHNPSASESSPPQMTTGVGGAGSAMQCRLFDMHDLCVSCVNIYQIPPYTLPSPATSTAIATPHDGFSSSTHGEPAAGRRVYLEQTIAYLCLHHPLSLWRFVLTLLSTRANHTLTSPADFVYFCRSYGGGIGVSGILSLGLSRVKRRKKGSGAPPHLTLKRCVATMELVLYQLQHSVAYATSSSSTSKAMHMDSLQTAVLLSLALLGDVAAVVDRLTAWHRLQEATALCCSIFALYNTSEVRWWLGVEATAPGALVAAAAAFPLRSGFAVVGVGREGGEAVGEESEEEEQWGDTWQDASTSSEDEEEEGGGGLSWREVEGEDGRSECTRTDASAVGDAALLLAMWRSIGKQYRSMFRVCFQEALEVMEVDLAYALVAHRPSPAMGGVGVGGGITDVEIVQWFDEVMARQQQLGTEGGKALTAGHLRRCVESLTYLDLLPQEPEELQGVGEERQSEALVCLYKDDESEEEEK